jgi:thiol-disulfide isomerase/thioredoxin
MLQSPLDRQTPLRRMCALQRYVSRVRCTHSHQTVPPLQWELLDSAMASELQGDKLERINSRETHDAAISLAKDRGITVLIYVVSDANPVCRSTTPWLESLAQTPRYSRVRFFYMELTPETAPMIKFGIQNTPIFIFYRNNWCQTVLGADMKSVERLLAQSAEE